MDAAAFINRVEHKFFGGRIQIMREKSWRRDIDRLRNQTLCITPIDTTIQLLRLKGLMPDPMIALEPFGKCGLMKTMEYVHLCQSLEFFEIDPVFARVASRLLPRNIVEVREEDSVRAINEGRLLRRDYSFIFIDCPILCFGPGYCENFDIVPRVFDYLGERGVVVLNTPIDEWVPQHNPEGRLPPEHERRRREFYGKPEGPIAPTLDAVTQGYISKVPKDRFQIEDCFAVPHAGPMMFLTLCLKRTGSGNARGRTGNPA